MNGFLDKSLQSPIWEVVQADRETARREVSAG
jgi:hypothetical protein